jgi:hypothetical protein
LVRSEYLSGVWLIQIGQSYPFSSMLTPTLQAQPPLEFIPPAFNPIVFWGVRSLLPVYRHWRAQIDGIEVTQAETLVELYQQFQAGNVRFLLAFRHPSINDPLCMAHLLWERVPHVAKQRGFKLDPRAVHAHFIYDRGIPLWAGEKIGWLYSRLGGTPIRRGKVDLMGLRSIRQLFATGQFPMAAAPEGATNGHNELVSPIEPGIAQFGFWCIEDLQKEGRSQPVVIVPIGIQYSFVEAPWRSLEQLLRQLEIDSGLSKVTSQLGTPSSLHDGVALTSEQEAALYKRLYRLGEWLLWLMEDFYRKFYHQDIPKSPAPSQLSSESQINEPIDTGHTANSRLSERLQRLLNAALTVAEQYFNLPAKGTITDRCRRLEQAGWDWIYREDLKQIELLPLVERGLADRIAEEASLRLWHMRLVETFVSVTGYYVAEKLTVDRFAETLLLLWDMVARLTGKSPFARPKLGQQRVYMTVGTPISVSDRWPSYQTNRRQAVASLTQDLQTALEQMIR